MNQIDPQDKIIYGVLGLSFLALLLLKGGEQIEGINAQSLVSRNASSAARDSRIAEKRFGNCSSGFVLSDGTPNLIEGEVPLDIRSRTPLASGGGSIPIMREQLKGKLTIEIGASQLQHWIDGLQVPFCA